jgi:cysteine desulfurase
MTRRIYFDNAATTSLDRRVLNAMMPCFDVCFGNASSLHTFGTQAKEVLDRSRSSIARCIGANPEEIFFTSSGTESNNLALKGIAYANRNKGKHIIISSIEHDCIMNTCKWLEAQGFYVSYLSVDNNGVVDVEKLAYLINNQTVLVSVMYANNELGTIEPVDEIGSLCRHYNIPFHTDACQAFGKIPIDVNKSNIDLMTINSHKIYGPKGVGALYVRKGINVAPLLHGGGQEGGLRSSTENIAGIAGFAKAAELCIEEMDNEIPRLIRLRKMLTEYLHSNFNEMYVNGHPEERLPGHLCFSFHGLEGETIRLLLLLDEAGIAVSAGSACSSNDKTNNASHVLRAIGLNPLEARGAIRLTLGRFNTEEDIEAFKVAINKTVLQLNPIFS